jgi:hypothetical protein
MFASVFGQPTEHSVFRLTVLFLSHMEGDRNKIELFERNLNSSKHYLKNLYR